MGQETMTRTDANLSGERGGVERKRLHWDICSGDNDRGDNRKVGAAIVFNRSHVTVSIMRTKVFALIALLGFDYLCFLCMPLVIIIAALFAASFRSIEYGR